VRQGGQMTAGERILRAECAGIQYRPAQTGRFRGVWGRRSGGQSQWRLAIFWFSDEFYVVVSGAGWQLPGAR